MNISLTKNQREYIERQIQSGDFQNCSEVVGDALQLHETYCLKIINELKLEIQKGWDGPDSSRLIQDIIEEKKNNQ